MWYQGKIVVFIYTTSLKTATDSTAYAPKHSTVKYKERH